ncbi:IS91 family transposase [Microbulbifer sp. SH-1]|uniref:IS91 family transposase n=1 Tax=Microbulbifer sp. SH-1 TaxID=2681547 RepID=UPI00140D89B3|nr:transposase [Microbulbifer sp. SH-1]QIL88805.1 IS91 family transposase [Microbulbifer sp. SH-1]QIL89093.1 IS91 family transposase [Microbulbifer sp. SH-1]QIL90506.1 IS91 family transposase [Microbulbifer sp. SH-1]
MTLQTIVQRYRHRFIEQFGHALSRDQWSALNAIEGCRQGPYGEMAWTCQRCSHNTHTPRSCGHRACNLCQDQSTQAWLQRQEQKRLPVNYYMVTFTLPKELRGVVRQYRSTCYDLLMRCAAQTLKTFAKNDSTLGGELGFCAVLHTHTRRLDYHPHVHIVVPGGAVNKARRQWCKVRGQYLFNGRALAKAFRGAFLKALFQAGITPGRTPKKWVAQCKRVGKGTEALRYLARYLYRGVISNTNILSDDGCNVTFRYRDANTHQWKTRTVTGEQFIALILQHCLPKGFRRARDYGYLHGNAKAVMHILQWVLKVQRPAPPTKKTASLPCPHCRSPMRVTGIYPRKAQPG